MKVFPNAEIEGPKVVRLHLVHAADSIAEVVDLTRLSQELEHLGAKPIIRTAEQQLPNGHVRSIATFSFPLLIDHGQRTDAENPDPDTQKGNTS